MPVPGVNQGLASLSDNLLFVAVVLYALAMLGYAAEYAFGGAGRVGVTAGGAAAGSAAGADGPVSRRERRLARAEASAPADGFGATAVALTFLGWAAHVGSVTTRGLSVHRVPWGNMYEFSSMVALVAVTAYLVLLTRQRVRYLGAFVMLPVVLYLGLAGTVLYAQAAPLVPALNSYWIKIHVVAAMTSSGIFIVGAVVTVLYLIKERSESRAVGLSLGPGAAAVTELTEPTEPIEHRGRGGFAGGPRGGIVRRLPSAAALDRTAYRVFAFAFPIWTFAIVAGAIWAEAAWGRYWGWDPKETWSFITWAVFAGYLHARSTAGWKGRKAAYLALAGFVALVIDYYAVNIWISGLHSYAGI